MSKRADEMVGKARWRATRDGEIVNDDQTIDDVLEMLQRGCLVLNTKLTPRRKAIAHILSKAFSESDDDDAFFFAQTFFMNLGRPLWSRRSPRDVRVFGVTDLCEREPAQYSRVAI